MNVYCRNQKAAFTEYPPLAEGSSLLDVYDPMLALRADFLDESVTIRGDYGKAAPMDSLCLGLTNAFRYRLETREGVFAGTINGLITIHDFDETVFTDYFILELEGIEDPLYLGHLFLGQKTVLPRFAVEPETGITLASESGRSFGGQAFGMRRKTLESFSAKFPRLTVGERETVIDYVNAVLNVEPHIIDPYPKARDEFPPMYATLNIGEVSMQKRNENGFYYSGSLSWQEAK